jgi:hypothetical protein
MLKKLQSDLDAINHYLHTNDLFINNEKTTFMHITTSHTERKQCTIFSHNEGCTCNESCTGCPMIKQVETFRYLGIEADENWKFYTHVDNTIKKIRKIIPTLYATRNCFTIGTKKLIYESFVLSAIRYACTIYGSTTENYISRLQKTLNKAIKALFEDGKKKLSTKDIIYKFDLLNFAKIYRFSIITTFFFEKEFQIPTLRPIRNNTAWLQIPTWRNSYGRRSLNFIIPTILNEIPLNVRRELTVSNIKKKIKIWLTKQPC